MSQVHIATSTSSHTLVTNSISRVPTMLGGLYGDLPPPSSTDDEKPINPTSIVWSSSVKMAPPTLRKPFATPQIILKSQPKAKPQISLNPKPIASAPSPVVVVSANDGPALGGLTSLIIEEYDPARPNDYEEYKREKRKKAADAELKRELDRRRQEEEERESFDKERERDLSVSDEEAWKRRAAMNGGAVARREQSPDGNGDGFWIGN